MEKRITKGRKGSKTSVLVTIGIFVVGGVLLFTLVGLVSDIKAAKAAYSADEAYEANLVANNDELKMLLSGDDYIQRIARDKYGFVLPGEDVFVDISGN